MRDAHIRDACLVHRVYHRCPGADRRGQANARARRQPPAADARSGHGEPEDKGEANPYQSWEVKVRATAVGRGALQDEVAGGVEYFDGARNITDGEGCPGNKSARRRGGSEGREYSGEE